MKKILLLVLGVALTLALGFLLGYRYGSPGYRLSPMANVESKVGPALLRVNYSRPYTRGRVIFGEVVRYGRVWRTGANEETEIEFDRPLRFNGVTGPIEVAAGRYSLFTLPEESQWTLILNSQTGQWGTKYDSSLDVARIPMTVTQSDPVEQLTIEIQPQKAVGASQADPALTPTALTPTALNPTAMSPTAEETSTGLQGAGVISVRWQTTRASAEFYTLDP